MSTINNNTTENQENENDLLFQDDPGRFVLLPIKNKEIWEAYKKASQAFWVFEEIDFSRDLKDWKKLNQNEQTYIKHVLAFFATSDGIVNENLLLNIISKVKLPEARCFYGFQFAIENIHAETYANLIDMFIPDRDEKSKLFRGMETMPFIKKKADWAFRYINDEKLDFSEILVAFAVVEGIFFSSSFCAIFWLKHRNLMPGLTTSNEFISRDEGMHTDFACLLYKLLSKKLGKDGVIKIIKEAVILEQEFARDALPIGALGINSDLISEYIEFVADRLFMALGFNEKIYGSKNPFSWMEMISIQGKANIHDIRPSEYAKTGGDTEIDINFSLS